MDGMPVVHANRSTPEAENRGRPWAHARWLAVVCLVALGLRLAAGCVVERQTQRRAGPEARYLFPDSYQFHAYAWNLLETGTYVDNQHRRAWRTPAYSLLLAGLYAMAGDAPALARGLTNLLDVVNVLLVFLLARQVFGARAARLAAVLAAVYPFFVYFSNLVLADTLSVGAVLLVTLAFVRLGRVSSPGSPDTLSSQAAGPDRRGSLRFVAFWAALAGLALAFAVLVRAAFGLLGVVFVGFLVVRLAVGRGAVQPAQRGACPGRVAVPVIVIAFCLGLAPWWVRNARVFGTFVPLSTMGGYTLYESDSPHADGGPNFGKIPFPEAWHQCMERLARDDLSAREQAAAELRADRILREAGLAWIRKHPGCFLALMPVKLFRTWNLWPNWRGARAWSYKAVSLGSYGPVLVLALWALWTFRARWREILWLVLPALYVSALHAVFMGSIRYRLPAMGCMIVLAAGGLDRWIARRAARGGAEEAS